MSVETTDRKVNYTMATGTTDYAFTFRALVSTPSDIKCIETVGGVETDLTYTTDYSVAINSNGVGGTVTVVTTRGSTYLLTIYRDTTDLQESDYEDYNQFPANTLEKDLDRRTMKSQESIEDISRAVKTSITQTGSSITLPSYSAGKGLIWGPTSGTIVNSTDNIDDVTTEAASSATVALNASAAAAVSESASAASAVDAAASAASLPTISGGDAGKYIQVNVTEDGYDFVPTSSTQSLDAAYGNGSTVTVDTGSVIWNSTLTAADAFKISQNAVLSSGTTALNVYSNSANIAANSYLLQVVNDNASSTADNVHFRNDGTGNNVYINVNNNLATGKYGLYLWSNDIQSNGGRLAFVYCNNASSTDDAMAIQNDGSGSVLYLVQNGTLASGRHGLYIYSNEDNSVSETYLLNIKQDNAAATGDCFNVENEGTGHGIRLNQAGVLQAAHNGLIIYSNAVQANAPLAVFQMDNASSSHECLSLVQDGSLVALSTSGGGNTGIGIGSTADANTISTTSRGSSSTTMYIGNEAIQTGAGGSIIKGGNYTGDGSGATRDIPHGLGSTPIAVYISNTTDNNMASFWLGGGNLQQFNLAGSEAFSADGTNFTIAASSTIANTNAKVYYWVAVAAN